MWRLQVSLGCSSKLLSLSLMKEALSLGVEVMNWDSLIGQEVPEIFLSLPPGMGII